MNKIILASHGGLSAGMKDTVQMVFGDLPNLYALATTRDETESIVTAARRLLDSFDKTDKVYILTDVLGGSVNNDMMTLLGDYPDLVIICGMNLSLVLTLAVAGEAVSSEDLESLISQAREQIVNCTEKLLQAAEEEEDDL
ncbi:PTS fructose transporter subunit IIA [Clostridium sp. MCC353]|uniref:PTS sugar transporter subunit IIA n=1 Tax=Clostridium sp. MCC353 TaxID=2592646 RepID=UPI001C024209|nr:PTS fructose transporter subunit IIA [Clostridium sp. MCC353]MBT9778748.1 PTS fructose transporter subunit IIA [Clostridium sp. MCC353]